MSDWIPDILGPGFEQRVLDLGQGDEATLVRYVPAPPAALPWWKQALHRRADPAPMEGVDVLYVHGWSDYFFQRELAEFWAQAGANFYAVDLRNYGRSLREGSVPGFITDLADYDREFNSALVAMGRTSSGQGAKERRLIVIGHSTGGLSISGWASRHPGAADLVILNSPWLEFQATELGRAAVAPWLQAGSRFKPQAVLPTIDPGIYTRMVSNRFNGEWDYDFNWRPERGFPLTPAFLNAVFTAQRSLARGWKLDVPVLVLLSEKSYLQPRWSDAALGSDVALNVDVVARRAPWLGPNVTIRRIHGAFHDVVLSPGPVRHQAYSAMGGWAADSLKAPPPWLGKILST